MNDHSTKATEPKRKKLILLNGPPGCGKDTGANAICAYVSKHAQYLAPRHFKFAEPLKKAAHALVDAFVSWDHFDRPEWAKLKDVPSGEFFGLSPRELYIKLSEGFAKPVFEKDFFGFVMRKRLGKAQGCMVAVISDAGFVEEVENLVKFVGADRVLILEIHANGKDFSGDSRGYIGDEIKRLHPEVTLMKIPNDFGDINDRELFKVYCQGAAKKFLKLEEREGVL